MEYAIQTDFSGGESVPLCFVGGRHPEAMFFEISLKRCSDTFPVDYRGDDIADIGDTVVSALVYHQDLVPYDDFPGHHVHDNTGTLSVF